MTKIVVLDGRDNLDHYYPSVVQKCQGVKQAHRYDDYQNYPHACEAQALAKEMNVEFVNELGAALNNSRAALRMWVGWEVLWHPMPSNDVAAVMFYCTWTKREWEGMRRVLFYLHV